MTGCDKECSDAGGKREERRREEEGRRREGRRRGEIEVLTL